MESHKMEKKLVSYTIIPEHLYVNRDADRQLESVISEMGRPGYVLVSRQMGKTNLLLNVKRKLENDSDFFIYIDLSNSYPDARSCFENIIDTFLDIHSHNFPILENKIKLLRKNHDLPAHRQFQNEIRELLKNIKGKLVIILDEIDGLIKTNYSDIIFSQIRSVYFSRVNFPEFERLTYILSGVIEPKNLIKDPTISPFNIGYKIFLNDFTLEEFLQLVGKISYDIPIHISEYIYSWTNGNPRLSWDILSIVEDYIIENGICPSEKFIDEIINQTYLINFDKPPVDHIRELVKVDSEMRNSIIGLLYKKNNSLNDAIKEKLYLAGIINYSDDGSVFIKNKIIEKSLNEEWLLSIKEEVTLSKILDLVSNDLYKQAIQAIQYLLEQKSNDFTLSNTLTYQLGYCYYKEENYTKALECLDKVNKKIENDSPLVYYNSLFIKGKVYYQQQKFTESEKCFVEILDKKRFDDNYISAIISFGMSVLHDSSKASFDYIANFLDNVEQTILNEDFENRDIALIYINFIKGYLYKKHDKDDNYLKYFQKALEAENVRLKPQIYNSLIENTSEENDKHKLIQEYLLFLENNNIKPNPYSVEHPMDFSGGVLIEFIKIIIGIRSDEYLSKVLSLYDNISNNLFLSILEDFVIVNDTKSANFLANYIERDLMQKLDEFQLFQFYGDKVAIKSLTESDTKCQIEYIEDLYKKKDFYLTKIDMLIISRVLYKVLELNDKISGKRISIILDDFKYRILEANKIDFVILLYQRLIFYKNNQMPTKNEAKELLAWLSNHKLVSNVSLIDMDTIKKIKDQVLTFINSDLIYERNDIIEYEFDDKLLTSKYKYIQHLHKSKSIRILNILS